MHRLTVPISEGAISRLKVGDSVSLSGVILTARDAAHKFMVENFIQREPPPAETDLYQELRDVLRGGAIYHCGPVIRERDQGWEFVAAGPTTSIREEVYEPQVIEHFGVRAVIGKGGMGAGTLEACQRHKAVYVHAAGGAAALIATTVSEVLDVYKLEFGVPEAMWKIRVEGFPAVVTMDAHGNSLHAEVERRSRARLEALLEKSP